MSLNSEQNGNEILVPIEIKLDKLEQLEGIVQRLREASKQVPDVPGGIPSPAGEAGQMQFDSAFEEMVHKTLDNIQIPQGPGSALTMMRNPSGFLIGLLSNPYVAAALMAAGLGPQILDWLTMHGMPFDKNFKRILVAEDNVGRRREDRMKVRVGLQQVIFANTHGHQSPEYAFNSYQQVNDKEIFDMDIYRIRTGYRF